MFGRKPRKKIGFGWADCVIRQAGSRADVAFQWGESHSKVEFIFLYLHIRVANVVADHDDLLTQ